MKKTLLTLLAAGALGCSGFPVELKNPAPLKPNEDKFAEFSYLDSKTSCTRWVYVGVSRKYGALQSVLVVEHCLKAGEIEGNYVWQRYEDNDIDGKFDICSYNHGNSYVGGSVEGVISIQCSSKEDKSMQFALNNALRWAKKPIYINYIK